MNKHVFDREKWAKMSIFDQMGNIGTEVGRAMTAIKKGDAESTQGAVFRALDLLDATADGLAKVRSPRLREVLRSKEQFISAVAENKVDQGVDEYFFQFALVARLQSGR